MPFVLLSLQTLGVGGCSSFKILVFQKSFMKSIFSFIVLYLSLFLLDFSNSGLYAFSFEFALQEDLELVSEKDSLALRNTFEQLSRSKSFQKEIIGEQDVVEIVLNDRKIIFGDFNGDEISDAIVPFSIRYIEGKVLLSEYCAYFLREHNAWVYKGIVFMNTPDAPYIREIFTIKDQKVIGRGTSTRGKKNYFFEYVYHEGELFIESEDLHPSVIGNANPDKPLFIIFHIHTPDLKTIPLEGTVKEYQDALWNSEPMESKNDIQELHKKDSEDVLKYRKKQQVEVLDELYFDFAKIRKTGDEHAVLSSVVLKGNDYMIHTNVGILNQFTSLSALEDCYEKDALQILPKGRGSIVINRSII